MANLTPDRYRQVARAEIDAPLTAGSLRRRFVGREVYRRTRYIVVTRGEEAAVIEIAKTSEKPLFSPVTDVVLLAGPDDTSLVIDADVDTGIPSHLADAAARLAPTRRCVAVIGRYSHLSFILDPEPVDIVVRDVVPPHPAKLVDQVKRVIDVAEELPPIRLIPDVVDLDMVLEELVRSSEGDGDFLLPCAGAVADRSDVAVSYLDRRPPQRAWTLIGCGRSQQIHTWFYGAPAPIRDFCPRRRSPTPGQVVLSKCCLLESGLEVGDSTVYVPWGSDLVTVKQGLTAAVELAAGSPAAASRSGG